MTGAFDIASAAFIRLPSRQEAALVRWRARLCRRIPAQTTQSQIAIVRSLSPSRTGHTLLDHHRSENEGYRGAARNADADGRNEAALHRGMRGGLGTSDAAHSAQDFAPAQFPRGRDPHLKNLFGEVRSSS